MSKLAILSVALFALMLVISTIGFIVGIESPAHESAPVAIPAPTMASSPSPEIASTSYQENDSTATEASEPVQTLEPVVTPVPTPTSTPFQILTEPVTQDFFVRYGEQPPYARTGDGYDKIQLVNNATAADPSWEQLASFLLSDPTDEQDYVPGVFMCGSFAEEVHNNAEAAGIRAAWVSLDFESDSKGHALNAFYTTDRGLVFVDCGGEWDQNTSDALNNEADSEMPEGFTVYGVADNWDKIAYVELNKECGLVSIEAASCSQYVCYEDYMQRKAAFEAMLAEYNQRVGDYNTEVAEYNEWILSQAFIEGSAETERLQLWYEELEQEGQALNSLAETLDEEGKSLGAFWQPLGTVTRVEIFW
jgi:hypothetical protein